MACVSTGLAKACALLLLLVVVHCIASCACEEQQCGAQCKRLDVVHTTCVSMHHGGLISVCPLTPTAEALKKCVRAHVLTRAANVALSWKHDVAAKVLLSDLQVVCLQKHSSGVLHNDAQQTQFTACHLHGQAGAAGSVTAQVHVARVLCFASSSFGSNSGRHSALAVTQLSMLYRCC